MEPVDRNLVRRLCREGGIPEEWATALVRHRGACAYCGRNPLADPLGYVTAHVDRLLPPLRYPDYVDVRENGVLSCGLCIRTRRDWDPLDPAEKPEPLLALRDRRLELIRRVARYIELRRGETVDAELRAVSNVLLSGRRARAGTPRLRVVSGEPADPG